MKISAIVARAANGVIGHEGGIPWYLPADLQFFKRTTLGHPVIMGRKCFESIGRPLPKRTNIVITRDLFYLVTGCLVMHSLEDALDFCEAEGHDEVFIIGGAEIYRQTEDIWDTLYLTDVACNPEGDTFFELSDPDAWLEVWQETHQPDEKNQYAYTFRKLERRT